MAKYTPLGVLLEGAALRGEHSVALTFAQVDGLVGGLPPSSTRRQWWANNSQVQSLVWREAGWHVDWIDMDARRVRFSRGRVGGTYADRGRAPARVSRPATSRPEMEALDAWVDVRVRSQWIDAGTVTLDLEGKPRFAELPAVPGIYRLTLTARPGQSRERFYFGETDNLRRRAGNYRNPGPTQQTSLRINGVLREHLAADGRVEVAVATEAATIDDDRTETPLDLHRKASRLLAENAALVLAEHDGVADIENLG